MIRIPYQNTITLQNQATGSPTVAIASNYNKLTITASATTAWRITTLAGAAVEGVSFKFTVSSGNNAIMLGFTNVPNATDYNSYNTVRRLYMYRGNSKQIYWYTNGTPSLGNAGGNGNYIDGDEFIIVKQNGYVYVYRNNTLIIEDTCPDDYNYVQITTEVNANVPLDIDVKLNSKIVLLNSSSNAPAVVQTSSVHMQKVSTPTGISGITYEAPSIPLGTPTIYENGNLVRWTGTGTVSGQTYYAYLQIKKLVRSMDLSDSVNGEFISGLTKFSSDGFIYYMYKFVASGNDQFLDAQLEVGQVATASDIGLCFISTNNVGKKLVVSGGTAGAYSQPYKNCIAWAAGEFSIPVALRPGYFNSVLSPDKISASIIINKKLITKPSAPSLYNGDIVAGDYTIIQDNIVYDCYMKTLNDTGAKRYNFSTSNIDKKYLLVNGGTTDPTYVYSSSGGDPTLTYTLRDVYNTKWADGIQDTNPYLLYTVILRFNHVNLGNSNQLQTSTTTSIVANTRAEEDNDATSIPATGNVVSAYIKNVKIYVPGGTSRTTSGTCTCSNYTDAVFVYPYQIHCWSPERGGDVYSTAISRTPGVATSFPANSLRGGTWSGTIFQNITAKTEIYFRGWKAV